MLSKARLQVVHFGLEFTHKWTEAEGEVVVLGMWVEDGDDNDCWYWKLTDVVGFDWRIFWNWCSYPLLSFDWKVLFKSVTCLSAGKTTSKETRFAFFNE